MKPYDALIFDLDGTLWDATETISQAWNEVLLARGDKRTLSPAQLAASCGLTADEFRVHLFPDLNQNEGQKLLEQGFSAETEHLLSRGGKLFPSVKENIPLLSKKYALFIVSNCEVDYLKAFFTGSGLQQYFADWECHGRTRLGKGENLADLIQRNLLKNPVYIGDTPGDEHAANYAKVPFFHAAYGFAESKAPLARFKSFSELSQYFLD